MTRKGGGSKKGGKPSRPDKRRSRGAGKRSTQLPSSPLTRKGQGPALRGALDYIQRLGTRKAAQRLDLTVSQLKQFLRQKRFPAALLPEAKGLGTPGTGFAYIIRTKLSTALKRHGAKKLAELTGLPAERILQLKKLRPRARIKVSREHLDKLIKKHGASWVAKALGSKRTSDVTRVTDTPRTETTTRLGRFVSDYGLDSAADFLGISASTISKWLRDNKNVPRSWEGFINRTVGNDSVKGDRGASREDLERGDVSSRPIKRLITDAWKRAQAWNKKVPARFRLNKQTVEKWARTGEFTRNFATAKSAYEEWKKPEPKAPKKAPPPVKTPAPAPPSFEPTPPAPLPTPPKQSPKAPVFEDAVIRAMKEFEADRAIAIAQDKDSSYRPHASFGKIDHWILTFRRGVRLYEKVREFVPLLNLTAVGNKVIRDARKLWRLARGDGEMMTVRFTFSAQGSGNPFYSEAFEPDKNEFTFFTRNTDQIFDPRNIDRAVRAILKEAWDLAEGEDILLYLEHYEIIKSIPREAPEPG
jgi:hypothetical protein